MSSQKGKLLITWQDVENDLRIIVKKIQQSNKNYKGLVVIARGGLGVAAILSRLLDIKLLDMACLASYDNASNSRLEINDLKKPTTAMEDLGENWLVIDDVIDSGATYDYIRELLPKADFSCLYNKSDNPEYQKLIIYAKAYSKDTWIEFPWEIA
ncbi:phosphoribosyltransferase family protein [Rickettsiales bacterium LUAb2]